VAGGGGEVRVWWVDVTTADIGALERLLSDGERDRAAGIPIEEARRRYVVARGSARSLLGRMLERDPAALEFESRCAACGGTDHGKPYVAGAPGVDFNVSHSADLVLVAAARGRAVGVDVEQRRERTDVDLVARALSPTERATLAGLPPERRRDAFFSAWTRKEAYLKGRGLGLAGGLAKWSVTPDGSVAPEGEGFQTGDARWRIESLDVRDGYAAAVAAEGDFVVRLERAGHMG
jgi:4'-phosphopantetheinyl transferase